MTSRGVVRFWRREDGWGAIDCVQTPGGCWVHFSEVEIHGFRALDPGQEVDFEWQKPTGRVEGFAFMATQVRPVRAEHDR
ncbi:cold-shock protein [Rhodococcus rhodochrous]|uniref:cold-shock protein n=1 Tax=Rhodococcus rhodochrous TaxID=1829 RepID=UPI001E425BA8|nr:cold shock domain-containing protein [Rhodococcus rhodochrous]MCD2098650.1 cold shock domain-containing protein [Rhodococcus rhodochrous]MCD2123134.1 cold shock domain-containing protein [Rhodococcus rhodochrous]MCQ4137879.1 cold shock domain-containing protein [Rhodococcus rhodochrous]MDJ0019708.1 cold shock domain-containing protein [Rhodococcus rhodochrous]